MPDPIKVWSFDNAPVELRAISDNGGDEDWLAVVPPEYADLWIEWLEAPHFGCCRVNDYPYPNKENWRVYIGCHA